jgi:beta-propeller repeat-containing protein
MRRKSNSCQPARTRAVRFVLLAALVSLFFRSSSQAAGPTLEWVRQFTPQTSAVGSMSLDGLGHIYLQDVSVRKFDALGNELSTFSVSGMRALSADEIGNVFVTGWNEGPFATLHDAAGNEIWRRQRGGSDAFADRAGNVYVSGWIDGGETEDDALVTKFDAAGNELWSTQFGGSLWDLNTRVSADKSGNVFAFGEIQGGVQRAFLTKLDSNGNENWTRELSAARFVRRGGVVADGLGNVYISGSANAPIATPRIHQGYDAFLAKYDDDGNQIWLREFGTGDYAELARHVTVDGLGNVFVAGTLDGPNVENDNDAFLAKYNVDGDRLWMHQFGSVENDWADFVSADGLGNIYIAGTTRGDFGEPFSGGNDRDVFLAKFRDDFVQLSGDFNNDGTVDAADYVVWRKDGAAPVDYSDWRGNFGRSTAATTPSTPGDVNNDGTVDAADYVAWRRTGGTPQQYDQWRTNFGRSAAAAGFSISSSETPVPEPASLPLLTVAAFAFGPLHRKRVRH